MSYKIIIPARYASTRLPGKPLLDIAGKPLIQHVYETACQSQANSVTIATDDERIIAACKLFGAEAIMTSEHHMSGTDRLAEVCKIQGVKDDAVIVNLQGDEIGMSPIVIDQVANVLIKNKEINMSTVCETIKSVQDVLNPNIVKVVMDAHNRALYFSRAAIPWDRAANGDEDLLLKQLTKTNYYRHIGLYAYRVGFLKKYPTLSKCELENLECLEQLRVLHHGESIYVAMAEAETGIGIDTEQDLIEARNKLSH